MKFPLYSLQRSPGIYSAIIKFGYLKKEDYNILPKSILSIEGLIEVFCIAKIIEGIRDL